MVNKLINTKIGLYLISSLIWVILLSSFCFWAWQATRPTKTSSIGTNQPSSITKEQVNQALKHLEENRLTAPTVTDTLKLSQPESTPSGVTEGR